MKIRAVGSKGASPSKSAEKGRSISFRTDAKRTSIKHNNRTVEDTSLLKNYGKHIKKDLTSHNKILVAEDIADVYQEEFSDAVKKYNQNKRKDRKISETKTGYLRKVKNDNTLDPQREFIVQMGRKEDQEARPISESDSNEIYTDYLDKFKKKFPDLRVYNAVIHHDEATPHMHFNVVPLAEGYKRGMLKKPAFSKVLKNHGMDMKEFCEWNRKTLGDLMEDKLGEKRQNVGSHDYVPPEQFRQGVRSATAKANSIVASAESNASNVISGAYSQSASIISDANSEADSMVSSADTSISWNKRLLNLSATGLSEQSGIQSMASVNQSQTSVAQSSSAVSLSAVSSAQSTSAYELNLQSTAQSSTAKDLDSRESAIDSKFSELSKIKQFIDDNMPRTKEFLAWTKQKIEEAKEAINNHDVESKRRVDEELRNESEDVDSAQSQANLFGDGLADLSSEKDDGLQR